METGLSIGQIADEEGVSRIRLKQAAGSALPCTYGPGKNGHPSRLYSGDALKRLREMALEIKAREAAKNAA